MDLQIRKIHFVQEFLRLDDEEIVKGLEDYLRTKKAEQLESAIVPMSLEQFNRDIDQALLDSKEGRVTLASDLKKRAKKWS